MLPAGPQADLTFDRARAGDPAAFGELVRRHQAMVYSIALYSLRNPFLAEELAQDVFLSLHGHLATLQSAGHLTGWLRKVTSNRCIDHARRRRLEPRVGLESAPEPATEPDGADPFARDQLQRLIARLPERHRMVVILRYQEEMDPREIAAALDMNIGTVKSTLHRSLALLRSRMEQTRAQGVVK